MNSLVIYPAFLDFQEVVIIMVVAVVIFGPDKIPEIARGLGSAVRKLKEASEDIKQEIMNPVQEVDPTKDIQKAIDEMNPLKEVKETFEKINPMEDFQKSFEEVSNPIDTIQDAIHQPVSSQPIPEKKQEVDSNQESTANKIEEEQLPTAEENKAEEVKVQEEQPNDKPAVNDTLGLGGSVSR